MCTILGHGHQCGKAIGCHKLWGPLNLATGGGLGTPKARPGPPMGHPIAPSCCMLALVGQLGPWGHWVVAPGAHTSPLWIHATTWPGPIAMHLVWPPNLACWTLCTFRSSFPHRAPPCGLGTPCPGTKMAKPIKMLRHHIVGGQLGRGLGLWATTWQVSGVRKN